MLAYIIPHNVNVFSLRQTVKELGIGAERIFLDNVPRYGRCFASDILVDYPTPQDAGRVVEGRHYLLAPVGFGVTFTATRCAR